MVNINNKSFINRDFNNVVKGDVLTDQLIISCFYNYFGKIKCGLLTFDQEDLGTKAELFNEETIFEKCDNVYSRTFDFDLPPCQRLNVAVYFSFSRVSSS